MTPHSPPPPVDPDAEAHFRIAAAQASTAARAFLEWMERAVERMSPDRFPGLAEEARRLHAEPLRAARQQLEMHRAPASLHAFAAPFLEAYEHVETSFEYFTTVNSGPFMQAVGNILAAWHHAARAQELFYAQRAELPAFAGFWQLPGTEIPDLPARSASDGMPATGVLHEEAAGHHGDFAVYVPETYTTEHAWPVIIALHGASGNGADFLWTWVREAKSQGYLLVAPTSMDHTWGEGDDVGLLEILSWLNQRYRVANRRVLLTGLSDGATFTLLYGLAHPDMYRALAPLCGVLHPANAALGNLRRARGVPIYLVHGAQDFLFPVAYAQLARDALGAAGANLEYRELPELSHTYPRSENVRILRWFENLTSTPPPS